MIMNSISDIKHAFYINLLSRPDRKQHVEHQLKTVGISAERFNAIKMTNGAIGCSMSHLKILEEAKKNKLEHILILEDDVSLLDPALFLNSLTNFLKEHENFLGAESKARLSLSWVRWGVYKTR